MHVFRNIERVALTCWISSKIVDQWSVPKDSETDDWEVVYGFGKLALLSDVLPRSQASSDSNMCNEH